jgi:hypothetical protein
VAQADRVQVLERVADAEQRGAARDLAAAADDLVQPVHIALSSPIGRHN